MNDENQSSGEQSNNSLLRKKKLLTPAEVAQVLGIARCTAGELVKTGRLSAVNVSSGKCARWLVRWCDLENYIARKNKRQVPQVLPIAEPWHEKELLTAAEVAAVLMTTVTTVGKLIRSGRLPAANIGSGIDRPRWAVRLCDLEEFLTPPIFPLRTRLPPRRW